MPKGLRSKQLGITFKSAPIALESIPLDALFPYEFSHLFQWVSEVRKRLVNLFDRGRREKIKPEHKGQKAFECNYKSWKGEKNEMHL